MMDEKKTNSELLMLTTMLDASNDSVLVSDTGEGRLLYANSKACLNLGYGKEELLGMRVMDIEEVFLDEESWWVRISFDENGVVSCVRTSENAGPCESELREGTRQAKEPKRSQQVQDPVVFIGGVARNDLQVEAFRRYFPRLLVPQHHTSLGALGAALFARNQKHQTKPDHTALLTLADDSGLEVDALGGEPGIFTARYGGAGLTHSGRYQLLLQNLIDTPWAKRTARFRAVIALAAPNGKLLGDAEGVCEGMIANEPAGSGGFGYDPVFFLPDRGMTMAQVGSAVKHQISHRGQAMKAIESLLRLTLK